MSGALLLEDGEEVPIWNKEATASRTIANGYDPQLSARLDALVRDKAFARTFLLT
ncbi:hypothetical protein ACLMJK_009577, partial [Lecanora helva]